MAYFGHFWANFMHVVHKIDFVIFLHKTQKMSIIYYIFCMAAEGKRGRPRKDGRRQPLTQAIIRLWARR